MKNNFKSWVRKIPIYGWVLFFIILVAVFLRTYRFSDWLHFAPDQARVGLMANDIFSGKDSWPLLGPVAGGTDFQLGPISFWWQLISAKIFGNQPATLAYPDCLWGIMAVGLLFFVLKEFFDKKLSLGLTFLSAVSYGLIFYSRFAWNPNATPFFTLLFLFSLFKLWSDSKSNKFWIWSLLSGLALGIDIQLHTFLLILLPIFIVIFWIDRWRKEKRFNLGALSVIFALALIINFSQIISEWKTSGANAQQFMAGVKGNKRGGALVDKVALNFWWNAKAQEFFLSSRGVRERADATDYPHWPKKLDWEHFWLFGEAFLWGIFILIGFYAGQKILKKKSPLFWRMITIFWGLAFILMTPFAYKMELRFFLFLYFIPFILLGALWKFVEMKWKKYTFIFPIILVILIFLNSLSLFRQAMILTEHKANSQSESVLGETQILADFIREAALNQSIDCVYLKGNKDYILRFYKSLDYLLNKNLIKLSKDVSINNQCLTIFINNASAKKKNDLSGLTFRQEKVFGNIYLGIYNIK